MAGRPGSDLLSRALRHSTIGATGFHGRVRNGIGCIAPRCGHQTKAKIRIVGFVSVSTSCWRVSVQSGFSASLLARALPGGCRHWSAGYLPPDIYRCAGGWSCSSDEEFPVGHRRQASLPACSRCHTVAFKGAGISGRVSSRSSD